MGESEPASAPHILIITADFYQDIADMLEQGAASQLERVGATYDMVRVPGALEIAGALSLALGAGLIPKKQNSGLYDGAVALGCIIRGETYHFEIVANESSSGLTLLAINHHIPIGNGILTVEDRDQALSRLKAGENHKGEHAAQACLSLINYKNTVQANRQ